MRPRYNISIKIFMTIVLNIFLLISLSIADTGSATIQSESVNINSEPKYEDAGPRLINFEFESKDYAVQLRTINEKTVKFLVLKNEVVIDSFELNPSGSRDIDLNNDNLGDISVNLRKIGCTKELPCADFSIEKFNPGLFRNLIAWIKGVFE